MSIVQIDVTTRCVFQCSGCTRMIGHVPVRDMDLDTFKRAVDSLTDHPGMIAIIGGEPLLWPHFDAGTDYLLAKTSGTHRPTPNAPVPDLARFLLDNYCDIHVRRGLFTSLPPNTIHHWEKILESYQFIGFNTHENAGMHQQFLVASGELPISRDQRLRLIQDCWVNKYWSCSITPQGCFPCEIMGSLAHAFDGPGPKQGWPIEKDWWRRPPSDWSDMLKWCDICGAAMEVPRLLATDDKEIVSPLNYERLKRTSSNKIARNVAEVFDVANYNPSKYIAEKHASWYLPSSSGRPDNHSRIRSTRNNLNPRRLECVMVCVNYSDFLEITLPWNIQHWDKVVVVTSSKDHRTAEIARKYGALVVISDSYQSRGATLNKGAMLNAGASALDRDDWMMFTDADILLPPDFRKIFDQHVWNPGTLYYATRLTTPSPPLSWIAEYKKNPSIADSLHPSNPFADQGPWGYFQLFHTSARSLRPYSESFLSAGGVDKHFMEQWPPDKRHLTDFEVVHIDHGPHTTNWRGRRSPQLGSPSSTSLDVDWTAVGWLDEHGYHPTLLMKPAGYLRLYRVDTGESIIFENRSPPAGGFVQDEIIRHSAHHCGFVTMRAEPSSIVIYQNHNHNYSGWGLGHVSNEDRQGYVWAGVQIAKTNFELFQKTSLSPEDTRYLLQTVTLD